MRLFFFLQYILKYKLFIKLNSYLVLLIIFILNGKKNNKKYGLVLSSERFRGEIELLKKNKNFYLIIFPEKVLNYLLIPFEKELVSSNKYYFKNNKKSKFLRKKIQHYFLKILNPLFRFYNIEFMIGASCYYKRDNDISAAGKILGAKYVVFLRENMAPFEIDNHVKYFDGRQVTKPDLIFTQCISTFKAYSRMKIFSGIKIINIGSLRMSDFIKETKKLRKRDKETNKNNKKKNIIFFSFTYHSLLEFYKNPSISAFGNIGLINLFKNSHNYIIDYAKKNKNIVLVIKTKWGGNWHNIIINNWKKYSNDKNLPKNVKITMHGDVHKMIFKADLVISFFSTAMCEAGLRDIPVIFLYFDEIKNKFKNFIDINWIKKSFFICNNSKKIEHDINLNLLNFKISKTLRKNRDESFQEYVSVFKEVNYKDLLKEINKIIT